MKKLLVVLKFFALVAFAVLVFVVTLPKKNIYYFLEEKLYAYDFIISNETIKTTPLSLVVSNADINYKGIEAGMFQTLRWEFKPSGIEFGLERVILSESIRNIFPANIDFFYIHYSILSPLYVFISGETSMGSVDGSFHLPSMKLSINLYPHRPLSANERNLLSSMSHTRATADTKEMYSYEYSY